MTNAEIIAEIRTLAAELDKTVPAKTMRLRKADLELMRNTLAEAVEAKRAREAAELDSITSWGTDEDEPVVMFNDEIDDEGTLTEAEWLQQMGLDHDPAEDDANDAAIRAQYALHEQPMVDSPAAVAQAEEDVFEVDLAVARRVIDHDYTTTPEAAKCESGQQLCSQHAPVVEPAWAKQTVTNVAFADVAVIVQSGSKLVWGKLINVVNRRTRYLPPFLCTVELESGVRQLVAADDILAA